MQPDTSERSHGSSGSRDAPGTQYYDVNDFLRFLGVDPALCANEMVVMAGHHMIASALPEDWSQHVDEETSRIYFFNSLTGDSSWSHPQEVLFRELIDEVKCWRPDEPLESVLARSDAHLRHVHAQAVEAIAQWSGPYDAPQGPEEAPECGESSQPPQYYYNATTGESRWADPRQSVEFDLRQCHAILSECVASHTQALAKVAASDDSEDEGVDLPPPRVQALVQNLWESIGSLPLPTRQPIAQARAPSPEPLKRPSHLPAGDETNRSSMSYLTARSDVTLTARSEVR